MVISFNPQIGMHKSITDWNRYGATQFNINGGPSPPI